MPFNDDDDKVARGATLFSTASSKRKKRKSSRNRTYDKNYFEAKRPKDEHNIKYIIQLVESQGTKLDFYKEKYLKRRTRSRISRTQSNSYKEYLELLKSSTQEMDALIDALSINVTRFFRNNDSWMELRDIIIPKLVAEKRRENKKRIKIWSAGCAVGAEPYSISIIVDNPKFRDMNFEIIASDINRDLLSIARNGMYDSTYLDEMNKSDVFDNFDLVKRDTYQVKQRIKRRVKFSQLDLTKDPFPNDIDMILCRNVMIYLKREAQDEIKNKFVRSLRTDGYLCLGRTETLSGNWRKQFDAVSVRHRIYQRNS